MKKFFVIPGFKQKATDGSFVWLKKFLNQKGFGVEVVPLTWSYKTVSSNIAHFESFYLKHKAEENYVLGFSYGAVIALMSAEKLQPKKVFLCSLSPDFREDVSAMNESIKRYIGKRRLSDCKTRSGKDIARKLTVPAVVFYGEIEGEMYPQLKRRCEETVKLAEKARLVVIKNSPHDIADPNYVEAIKASIK